MYISHLEMIGFKSFASKTSIDFRSGVMAVVGPNGCGKSNLVDAIRWVLGEQRTSTLRADRMEEVIFNGTQQRRPLGMAEVTLRIDNDKGVLPSPFSEVAITRRLFRSGESEYLINRTPSRLRDIHELFTDTGLGHNTYSIIELPMVEGIISGPSESRRALIEEAAGVAKFKARRNSALRRLASTRENLLRLNDVFSEIEKSYRSLKRQASRAQKHHQLAKGLELRILADLSEEKNDIIAKRDPLEARLVELNGDISETENDIDSGNTEITTIEGRELTLIDKSNRGQDLFKKLDRREAEMDGELALAKQRITYLEDDLGNADRRRLEIIRQQERSAQAFETAQKDVVKADKEHESIKQRLTALDSEFIEMKQSYENARKAVNETRHSEDAARAKLSTQINEARRRDSDNRRNQERKLRLEKEEAVINEKLNLLKARQGDIVEKASASEKRFNEISNELKLRTAELDKIRQRHNDLLSERAGLRADLEAARRSYKTHMARSSAAYSLPKSLKQELGEDRLITLAERLECDVEYRSALAAGLRPILDALDHPDALSAINLSRKFRESERAIFRIPVESLHEVNPSTQPELPNGCLKAADLVCNKGELGEFLKIRLDDLIVTPDRETMSSLIKWSNQHNLRLVTLKGELFEPQGLYFAGHIDADALQVGWSARRDELEREVVLAENRYKKIENDTGEIALNLRDIEQSIKGIRNNLRQSEEQVSKVNRERLSLEAEMEQNQRKIKENGTDLSRLEKFMQKSLLTESYEVKKDELEAQVSLAAKNRSEAVKVFQKAEYQRVQVAEKRASVSADLSRQNERVTQAANQVENFRKNLDQSKTSLAQHDAKVTQTKLDLDRVQQASLNIDRQLSNLKKEKADSIQVLEKLKEDLRGLKARKDLLKEQIKKSMLHQKELQKKRSDIETQVISLRERMREVDRRLTEETHVPPSTVSAETPNNAIAELETLGYADLSAEKLRTRLSSIGPVNMLALEELQPVEERYNFLNDQKKDLENGIEILEETIDRINSEARRKFLETFNQISQNFQRLFRTLFEGGEARIHIEGEDPLESDIKIWATPTGKKMQGLSMLSGGEKSLTAIALLFAIYEVRPSPFCILDEVDAPLDDANIRRFNRLVEQFTVNTQYLIITHNKRTMAAANSLIGVTLDEDGSSRLVSVKMEKLSDEENYA